MNISEVVALGPVMPVIVINDASTAVPLAQALLEGGVNGIEITLRTPQALDAIAAIAKQCPQMVVGAGTVLSAQLAAQAASAGAQFAVSPGTTDAVISGCAATDLPLLPGAATVSEMMSLMEHGFDVVKFFPAAAAGGLDLVRSLISPLPQLRICPTGGISATTAANWLALSNIPCVGGSWIAPAQLIDSGDWQSIRRNAEIAANL